MNDLQKNFKEILNQLIECIAIYRAMSDLLDKYKSNNVFINLFNNNAMMILIRLANVFGTDGEENHWKKVFSNQINDFEQNVICKVFENKQNYDIFHKNFTEFRSRYIAHFKVGEDKYLSKHGEILYYPYLDQVKDLVINSYLYFCKIFDSDSGITIEYEVNDFYYTQYNKTIKFFT